MPAKSPSPARPTLAAATATLNAWIEVDLDALAANVRAVRAAIGSTAIIAVVKANAYGHGAALAAPALEAAGVERFAVATLAEGVALREAGVTRPVLVLGHTFPAGAAAAVTHNLTLTVTSAALAEALAEAAPGAGKTPIHVHVKVDSGLRRFGLTPNEAAALASRVRTLDSLTLEALWTHMANADEEDDSFSSEQAAVFEAALTRVGPVTLRHAANTATALRRPELRYDAVRVGLALYGALPPNTPDPGVRPALALKARLARVFDVARGEGVSYGLAWRASRPSRIALVSVGYADGWRRALGNRGHVLTGGRRRPIVGRVCMDQFLIDVTDAPAAAPGDEAVLIGEQGGEAITAAGVAAITGTISYEVLTGLGARLPRLAHRNGLVTATG